MSIVIMYSYVPKTFLIECIVEMVQTAEPFAGNCQLNNLFRLTGVLFCFFFLTVNPECLK